MATKKMVRISGIGTGRPMLSVIERDGSRANSLWDSYDIDATFGNKGLAADAKATGDELRKSNPRIGWTDEHTVGGKDDGSSAASVVTSIKSSYFTTAKSLYGGTKCTLLEGLPLSVVFASLPYVTTANVSSANGRTTLEHIELQSLEVINSSMFSGCTALKSVYIPAAKTINNEAFRSCTALRIVNLGPTAREEAPKLGTGGTFVESSSPFMNTAEGCVVVVPDGNYEECITTWEIKQRIMKYSDWLKIREYGLDDLVGGTPVDSKRSIYDLNPVVDTTHRMIVATKRKTTSSGGGRKGVKPLVIAHFSDLHGYGKNLKRYIDFCQKYKDYIDVKLNTGDTVYTYVGDDFSFYANTTGADTILNALGNHDTHGPTSGSYDWDYMSAADARVRYIDPFLSKWGVEIGDGVCYYYKDFERAGFSSGQSMTIRLVVIDPMHFDQTQLDWLNGVLATARTNGYHVVIASHFVIEYSLLPSSFNPVGYTGGAGHIYNASQNNYFVPDVDTFKGAFAAVKGFIDAGGQFCCWLIGHSHISYVARLTDTATYGNQLVVCTDTAMAWGRPSSNPQVSWDADGVDGTKTQDAFNIVSINPELKTVVVQKIGRNIGRFGDSHESFCASYDQSSFGIVYDQALENVKERAFSAVQPGDLQAALRYDIGSETAITSASQEEVEGVTVNYGAATMVDRTANRVAITAALDELRLAFPAADSGKVRDFKLRVEVGTGSAALTAPALVPVAATGETVTLENPDGAIPALADGAADAKGVTLLYFSETAPGVFLAKGEQVKEVA